MLDIKRKKTKTKKNLGDMLNKDLINFSCVIFHFILIFLANTKSSLVSISNADRVS